MSDAPTFCSRSPTTSSSSAGGTPNGPGSRRSSRRTSRSRRSRRTRSGTRARCTSSPPRELGTTADELAFDRTPEEYRSAPLVELRRLEWARTIARHWLYETADEIRLAALKASDDPELAGLAAKIDREEAYHRMHAEMWIDRLLATDEGRPRLDEAVDELWPYALGVLDDELRPSCGAAPRSGSDARSRTSSPSRAARTRRSSPSCGRR